MSLADLLPLVAAALELLVGDDMTHAAEGAHDAMPPTRLPRRMPLRSRPPPRPLWPLPPTSGSRYLPGVAEMTCDDV